MSSTAAITLKIGKPSRGKFPVTLMQGGKVLLPARIDPHVGSQIDSFVADAKQAYPGLKVKQLRAQLLQLAAPTDEANEQNDADDRDDCEYRVTDTGLIWLKETPGGPIAIPLTNFTARIMTDTVRDDGAERQHVFEIEAVLAGSTRRFTVPAAQFSMMGWVIEHLGAGAIVHPGIAVRDRARAAIQTFSTDHATRTIYAHTGWLQQDEKWLYLHNDGAIGAVGAVENVEVDLSDALSGYRLPVPSTGDGRAQAIRASLRLLELAPDFIAFPVIGAIYRAPLGNCDFSIHLAGPSGVFKSELGALAQQHFGANMDSRHLPASWTSTDNALEGQAFTAKDAMLVIDDYAPGGTQFDVQKFRQKADRVFRGAGNRAGRSRMRPDGTLRPNRPPRCLIVSTGEDVPAGHSLRARMLVLELGPGEIDRERLTVCQADANSGRYAASMAAYLRWLAGKMDQIPHQLRQQIATYREQATTSSSHARTPEVVANLAVGIDYFLRFAITAKAITAARAKELRSRAWDAIGRAAAKQVAIQVAMEPAQRFLELLTSALMTGAAHLVSRSGRRPSQFPAAWGWRLRPAVAGSSSGSVDWVPQGQRIGWVDGDELYLDPDASFKAAQSMAAEGSVLTITAQTLRKRLDEKGLLTRESGRDELLVRRQLEGVPRRVLALRRDALLPAAPSISDSPQFRSPCSIAVVGGNGGNGGLPAPKGSPRVSNSNGQPKRRPRQLCPKSQDWTY